MRPPIHAEVLGARSSYDRESERDSPYTREIPEFASASGIGHCESGRRCGPILALISSSALREAVGEVRENQ
jgi:hypothetical protein